MPDENSELTAFVLRRGQMKAQLTCFQTFLNEAKSNITTQLRLRSEKIREAWSEFEAIQNNIELLDGSNNEQLQYRSTFEELYYDLMSQVEDRLSGSTIEFLVLSKITGSLPHTPIHNVSIPDNVNVADPSFNCPGNIDVLIGGDTYWDIMCDEKFKTKDGPYLQKTLFGWVVVGKTSTKSGAGKSNSCFLTTKNQYQLLDNKIELFWKMEELPSKQFHRRRKIMYNTF